MSKEDSKAAAMIIDEYKDGWEKWPSMKALPNEFGFRVWGKYMGPRGYGFNKFLQGLTVAGLLILAVFDWPIALVIGVILLVCWKVLIGSMLETSFNVEITPETFRVGNKKYKKFGPRGTAMPYEIRIDEHEKALEEAQQEHDRDERGSTKYRRSYQVVFQSLEKRSVVASIHNDIQKARQLHTRLQTLDQIVAEHHQHQ